MRRFQDDRRRDSRIQSLLPAQRAQAPTIARLQPRESILRYRRCKVVAHALTEGEKLGRHSTTDDVSTKILWTCSATTVAKEAGQGFHGTGLQVLAQDIAFGGEDALNHEHNSARRAGSGEGLFPKPAPSLREFPSLRR